MPVIRATIYVDDSSVPVDVSLECVSYGLALNLGEAGGRELAPAAVAVRAYSRRLV